jgi:hypothetical protein
MCWCHSSGVLDASKTVSQGARAGVADRVINAEEVEEAEARKPYRELRKKVLSHVTEMA